MIVAGIDEAGYGPTLGPLVVSAAAFRLPPAAADADPGVGAGERAAPCLWRALRRVVSRKPDRRRVAVADSKLLYRPGKGLAPLEEGVLAFLGLRAAPPADMRSLLGLLSPLADRYLDIYPWYRTRSLMVPTDGYANHLRVLSRRLAGELDRTGLDFLGLRAVPIEVRQFNEGLLEHRNKALVSFSAVSELLVRLWKTYPDEPIDVTVDRQGGRTYYAPLLFKVLSPRGIQIESQSAERSVYRLRGGSAGSRLRITFAREGEKGSFAVALASMVSKYVRELHMRVFNAYWLELQDDLRPTAGYPLDARRFLADTEALRRRLGTDSAILIRRC